MHTVSVHGVLDSESRGLHRQCQSTRESKQYVSISRFKIDAREDGYVLCYIKFNLERHASSLYTDWNIKHKQKQRAKFLIHP